MSEPAVANLSLARLVKIEQRIAGAEGEGLRARWEFGRDLLSARDGKGRLPNGYLTLVSTETMASRSELKYRMQFAEKFSTEAELANALALSPSWREVVSNVLPTKETEDVVAPAAAPLPEGVYRTIVADPPWQYGNTSTRGAAEDHYPTMSIAELCDLPVEEWAHDEAHLYLWTTNGFLREAFQVMDAWGFVYKTTLTWVKPQLGMGNYFRSSTEHVLFGVRGGMGTLNSNQINWFYAKRGRHSKKPGCFFDMVEKASPGPHLEMFARERSLDRQHWQVWGNEV